MLIMPSMAEGSFSEIDLDQKHRESKSIADAYGTSAPAMHIQARR